LKFSLSVKDDKDVPSNIANVTVFVKSVSKNTNAHSINSNRPFKVVGNSYSFLKKWYSNGTSGGQFDEPQAIAVDSSGNVYVADFGNNRIQKFDSNGNFITKWGSIGEADG
jgi:tripartite motif-containing protein 71